MWMPRVVPFFTGAAATCRGFRSDGPPIVSTAIAVLIMSDELACCMGGAWATSGGGQCPCVAWTSHLRAAVSRARRREAPRPRCLALRDIGHELAVEAHVGSGAAEERVVPGAAVEDVV